MQWMTTLFSKAAAMGLALGLLAPVVAAAPSPGTPGIGDPYFPLAGNGGYDVSHYDIRLSYTPSTDELAGTTTITARATQDLSQFDLDFLLRVGSCASTACRRDSSITPTASS